MYPEECQLYSLNLPNYASPLHVVPCQSKVFITLQDVLTAATENKVVITDIPEFHEIFYGYISWELSSWEPLYLHEIRVYANGPECTLCGNICITDERVLKVNGANYTLVFASRQEWPQEIRRDYGFLRCAFCFNCFHRSGCSPSLSDAEYYAYKINRNWCCPLCSYVDDLEQTEQDVTETCLNILVPGVTSLLGRTEPVYDENFLVVQKNVYFQHIFPHLSWNDLLRFRRVCKLSSQLANEYIKEIAGTKLCPQIIIYESSQNKNRSLANFLELGIPASRIYLMNTSGPEIFTKDSENFEIFLKRFGKNVTQLRVHQMSHVPVGMEYIFYEGLPNLVSLEVDMFGGMYMTKESQARRKRDICKSTDYRYPAIFRQLKKFTIGGLPNKIPINMVFASRELLEIPQNLEYAGDSYCSKIQYDGEEAHDFTLTFMFNKIEEQILRRRSLKCYDFAGYYEDQLIQNKVNEFVNAAQFVAFSYLCQCKENRVKLLNVNASWLQYLRHPVYHKKKDLLSVPVVTMVNMHGMAGRMKMPSLEKLVIHSTTKCYLFPGDPKKERGDWPKLEVLDVTIDSYMLGEMVFDHDMVTKESTCLDAAPTSHLIRYFFEDIERSSLKELTLKYGDGLKFDDGVTVEVVARLGKCCPNLKKLVLVNWPGSSDDLKRALTELPALEELGLKKCKLVGDTAFTMANVKNLKKLSLTKLDQMLGITDELFERVLCNLRLTSLTLGSSKPLKKITSNGVNALLNGEFSKSIESFSFQGWSIAGIGKDDFQKLGKMFRSSNMI